MSRPGRQESSLPDPAGVENFLRQNPEYLSQRPELLAALAIPDERTGTASLLERQVRVLRQQLRQLEQARAQEQGQVVAQTETLAAVFAALPVLVGAGDIPTLAGVLDRVLRQQLGAERLCWHLFRAGTAPLPPPFRVHPPGDPLRDFFAQVFNVGRPLLDSLQLEHRQALFGGDAERIRSTLLLPLTGDGWEGLLALGSRQPDRYHRGLALEAVRTLAEVTALRLVPLIPPRT